MKYLNKLVVVGCLIFGASFSYAETWSLPLSVQTIRVDMRLFPGSAFPSGTSAGIKFTTPDGTTYWYFYDSNNLVSIAKANQLLSTLLTAKSTSSKVLVYQNTSAENALCPIGGTTTCFSIVELQ